MIAWLQRSVFTLLVITLAACASHETPDEDDEIANNRNIPLPVEEGTGESEWIRRTVLIVPPQDVTPDDDYTLGPGDKISVKVDDLYQPGQQAKLDLEVSETGKVALPLAGDVSVRDLTATGATTAVTAALSKYLRMPQVTVGIDLYRSKKVHIYGSVRKPSTYLIPRNSISIIEGLSLGGGLSPEAGRNAIIVRKTDKDGAEQIMVDLEGMLTKGAGGQRFTLQNGDVLHVPEAEKVFVIGYVYKPGPFLLTKPITAGELIAQAGGPIPRAASQEKTFIRRRKADGNFKIIRMDVDEVFAGKARDVVLAPGDMVVVPQSGFDQLTDETWSILKGRVGANIPTVTGVGG